MSAAAAAAAAIGSALNAAAWSSDVVLLLHQHKWCSVMNKIDIDASAIMQTTG